MDRFGGMKRQAAAHDSARHGGMLPPMSGGVLERVRELKDTALVAIASDDLHADRQPAG